MAALGIDSELGFVDRREGKVALEFAGMVTIAARNRHAFGRAKEIARAGRDDSLFAGQQRDLRRALHRADAVVNLTRQKPQRETDDSGGMAAHALDREVRLARIGRTK